MRISSPGCVWRATNIVFSSIEPPLTIVRPLSLVAEHLVGLRDSNELFSRVVHVSTIIALRARPCPLSFHIGMVFQGEVAIGFLDLSLCRCLVDPENFVEALRAIFWLIWTSRSASAVRSRAQGCNHPHRWLHQSVFYLFPPPPDPRVHMCDFVVKWNLFDGRS